MTADRLEQIAVVAITRKGVDLGRRLGQLFPGSHLYLPQRFGRRPEENEHPFPPPARKIIEDAFVRYRYLVLITAVGAAVRLLAPHLRDKRRDPGVVVVDEAGQFAVSLLSGHLGGANRLATKIAARLGARPVITTASDVSGVMAVDLLGRELGWIIEDGSDVTGVSAALVNGEPVAVFQDAGESDWQEGLPAGASVFSALEELAASGCRAAIIVTDRVRGEEPRFPGPVVVYRPRSLVLGIGCHRGTGAGVIEAAVRDIMGRQGLSMLSLGRLATIDIKRDEAGLAEFAAKFSLPVDYYDRARLSRADFPSPPSAAALKYAGTPSVSEAAVIAGGASLLAPKASYRGAVTVAVGRLPFPAPSGGKLFVVGIGPGSPDHLTLRAREAIEASQVVVGYQTYIRLLKDRLSHQAVIATGMGQEVQQAQEAIRLARAGQTVSIVCSGDAGIYGMAGLVLEVAQEQGEGPDIEIVPGVPSLAATAACLGAPIMTDFAVVSLSDYLIPWADIEKRLELAAAGDFVIVIHNPRSLKRREHLPRALEIIREHRRPTTPAGIVSRAGREGQRVVITDLAHLLDHEIGMDTTVIIGNSATIITAGGRMVTPRGYQTKYCLADGARR